MLAGFYQNEINPTAKEYFEKIDYDLNGNIIRLQRSAELMTGNTAAFKIDNLRYDYTGNRLTKVTEEEIGKSDGYPYLASHNTIEYDNNLANGNGNMTKHLDKGISSIQYNFLNLPKQITQNAQVTNYVYRADGAKVKKLFGDIETNYLDGFQYKALKPSQENPGGLIGPNDVAVMKLRIIPTSEGYFDAITNQYIYNYTDHLGNIRLSYTDTNKDGVIQPRQYFVSECDGNWNPPFEFPTCIDNWKPGEIVEINNYYPFGLMHNYTATTQNAYQYKYNGKELQETGMYDYGARFYMPDIGRWGVVDPLAETSRRWSTYTYAYNNPINFIDPDGREGTGWGLKDNEWKFVGGMQKGDAAYQQGGYTDFRADGSVEPNVEITNSTAENTGMTYLGFNGETSYMPADSNGSTGMLGLSNWFRDAISGAESSIAGLFGTTSEEFPQITYNGGMARTDFDASTHDKLRPGDKTFNLDWGSFVAPSTFPVEGSAGGQGYALSWATDRMADIFNLNKRSGTDTLFMKATFVGNGKDYLRDTMFAEPYRKNETTEQVLNRQNKKFDSVKANSKTFITR